MAISIEWRPFVSALEGKLIMAKVVLKSLIITAAIISFSARWSQRNRCGKNRMIY